MKFQEGETAQELEETKKCKVIGVKQSKSTIALQLAMLPKTEEMKKYNERQRKITALKAHQSRAIVAGNDIDVERQRKITALKAHQSRLLKKKEVLITARDTKVEWWIAFLRTKGYVVYKKREVPDFSELIDVERIKKLRGKQK
jgi:hypothetical protein